MQDKTAHAIRTPKFNPTNKPHYLQHAGYNAKRLERTVILCTQDDGASPARDVVERVCVAKFENMRQNVEGVSRYRHIRDDPEDEEEGDETDGEDRR